MKANLKKKEEAAKLTRYDKFELEEERPDFTPGQYFFLRMKVGIGEENIKTDSFSGY